MSPNLTTSCTNEQYRNQPEKSFKDCQICAGRLTCAGMLWHRHGLMEKYVVRNSLAAGLDLTMND